MKTKIDFLYLAFLSLFLGLFMEYVTKSITVLAITQSLALLVLFLVVPDKLFKLTGDKKTPPTQDDGDLEIFCEEEDDKKEDSTGNQIALVIAVGVSSVTGIGIYLFSQILSLAIFVAIILFILVYKYKGIRNHFGELTWPFDVK